MPYTIYKADGTTVSVPDNLNNSSYYNSATHVGIQLVGRNKIDYGADIAQNILQLASCFAGSAVPSDTYSLQGQLWFDTLNTRLYVRVNPTGQSGGINNWQILTASSSPQIGNPLTHWQGTIFGYSTMAIPAGDLVSDYVALTITDGAGFCGWLRGLSGKGMTLEVTDHLNNIIGYAFPV